MTRLTQIVILVVTIQIWGSTITTTVSCGSFEGIGSSRTCRGELWRALDNPFAALRVFSVALGLTSTHTPFPPIFVGDIAGEGDHPDVFKKYQSLIATCIISSSEEWEPENLTSTFCRANGFSSAMILSAVLPYSNLYRGPWAAILVSIPSSLVDATSSRISRASAFVFNSSALAEASFACESREPITCADSSSFLWPYLYPTISAVTANQKKISPIPATTRALSGFFLSSRCAAESNATSSEKHTIAATSKSLCTFLTESSESHHGRETARFIIVVCSLLVALFARTFLYVQQLRDGKEKCDNPSRPK